MIRILFLCSLILVGCKHSSVPSKVDNSLSKQLEVIKDSESFSEWVVVDCPKCKGNGQMYISEDSPLIVAGATVGYHQCDFCVGRGKMKTNGRDLYTNVSEIIPDSK